MNNIENQIGMAQNLIQRARERSLANSKSPVKPKPETMWGSVTNESMNKSAIVESSRQTKAALNVSNMTLPSKLQKMKEKVKRDRSQKNDENRDNSLYGRQKVSGNIEELRESYNQHRKTSKNKDRSVSGLRSSLGAMSNGPTTFLNKTNFKEDPYDNQDLERTQQQNNQYNTETNVRTSQQIALQLKQQHDSQQTQMNKFKRSTQKSHQTLANYQLKYQKLEDNYKKFAQTITNQNQTDNIIMDLKYKTGISFMMKFFNRYDVNDIRWAFKSWRINSGIAIKQFNNQGKTLVLAKALQKMANKSINFSKIQCYQKWKATAFREQGFTNKERINSILGEMITNSIDFNRCIENDFYLAQILNSKVEKIVDVVSSDILFFGKDESNQESLKTYHLLSGEQIHISTQSLLSSSVLGKIVFDQRDTDQLITVTQLLQKDSYFNKDVDLPVNKERILQYNQTESNVFNKVRYLSLAMIKIQKPSKIGVLRLFFSSPQSGNSPTTMQMKIVNELAQVLPLFLQRIIDVRSQINSLALSNIEQSKQIQDFEFYNESNRVLINFNQELLANNGELQQNKQNLMSFTCHMVETFLRQNFEMENIALKQVVFKRDDKDTEMLISEEAGTKELVKINNHHQHNQEVVEDFLDHRKEYYIYQVSVCPLKQQMQEYDDLTFVFQVQNSYENNLADQNGSMVNLSTSLTSNIMSFSAIKQQAPRKYLEPEMKKRLSYFIRHLCPIIKSALLITNEFVPAIEQLQNSFNSSKLKYQVHQSLMQTSTELRIAHERNPFVFYQSMRVALSQALAFILPEQQESFDLFLNKAAFHDIQDLTKPNLIFHGFLDDVKTDEFLQNIVQTYELDEKRQQKYDIQQRDDGVNEVSLSLDVFEVSISQMTTKRGGVLVQVPIVDSTKYVTLAVITFISHQLSPVDQLTAVEQELQSFMVDFLKQRQALQELQASQDQLMSKLQGEKISQETRNLVEQNLVIPFLRKQSLKALGLSLDYLADKLITNNGQDLNEYGQYVSQIAFLGPKAFISEVRDLSTYSQMDINFQEIDKMLLQAYQLKQQIVYEDEELKQVVVLFPLMSARSYRTTYSQFQNAIIVRFVLDNDDHIELKVQNILSQFINVIAPVIDAILQHEIISVKQTYAIEKISNVIDKYKSACYRELIYFMRDLKAKNVYNFSRSRLYTKLAKSKLLFNQSLDNEMFDLEDKHLAQNQHIQAQIRKAIMTMNKYAFTYKQGCFAKFVIGTRIPLYAKMSKKKKKAISTLFDSFEMVKTRYMFLRFVINTQNFKAITHPKTKLIGSVECLFRNFRIVRERLAFIKLKKNLNIQLRNSMTSYKQNDQELFIQLNQILISSQNQQGGLEGGFSYSLSEIFSYLQNIMQQEGKIKDIGAVANDTFVGHADEAILSVKSSVYTPLLPLDAPKASQHLQIFMADLAFESEGQNNQAQPKNKALRLSYDSQIPVSQQDQIFTQINNQNLDALDQNDIVPVNEFESQLSAQYNKYQIALKKDLIHQMLEKSNGITFNFSNIQQSMSDIFLGQQSKHQDQNVGNRYSIVRRSKSALIIPLFDVSQQVIIGSFELYKHHQQAFTHEVEERYDHFAKLVSDFLLLFGQLRQQTLIISNLKWQMQKAIKPVMSLSYLLKNVYVNGPGSHFPAASHVMPIILLDQYHLVPQETIPQLPKGMDIIDNKAVFNQKLAFFYQFRDNHIYSFQFEGTFIEELLDNGCIMEMQRRPTLKNDEQYTDEFTRMSSIDNINKNEDSISVQSNMHSHMLISDQEYYSNRFAGQRHRIIQTPHDQIKTVTNELFKHIIYYPIFDVQDESKIIAVFEVAYKKRLPSNENLLTEEIQEYLDQFRSHLNQFKVRLNGFTRNLENLFIKRQQKAKVKTFQTWKNMMIFMQYKEQFQHNQFSALQNQEMCYTEYMQNLENYNCQIKQIQEEKADLERQLVQFSIEKKAKLKFLATSLLSSNNMFKSILRHRVKEAFLKWQYNISVRKVVETAFNRVLELNHRHSKARMKTGVYLLNNIVESHTMQSSFNQIQQAAHMRRFGVDTDVSPMARSRSKSRGAEMNSVLNNVTSLLSPMYLKKMERTNLYKQQINSFYHPNRNSSGEGSTFGNTKNQNMNNSDLPMVQLQPHEVIRPEQLSSSLKTRVSNSKNKSKLSGQDNTSKSPSRYVSAQIVNQYPFLENGQNAQRNRPRLSSTNPFRNLNLSQIEHNQARRDYTPILTTSKYNLQKIYYDKEHKASYHSARGNEAQNMTTFGKYTRSNSFESAGKNRRSRHFQYAPLETQLKMKQQKLDMIKQQLEKQKHQTQGSIELKSSNSKHMRDVNLSSIGMQNLSSHDLVNITSRHEQFAQMSSCQNNYQAARQEAERDSFACDSSTVANSKVGSRTHYTANTRRGHSKNKRSSINSRQGSRPLSRDFTRRADSNKSKRVNNKHAFVPTKYAEINGRDVSPPVRDR